MNIITRNIKGKMIALAVGLVIFIGLHVLFVTVLKDVNLFEWPARARTLRVRALACFLEFYAPF